MRKSGKSSQSKISQLTTFLQLCSNQEHKTLLLHTEVRWLSRGRVLGRLFELRDKVREFLKDTESEYITYLESHEFMLRLAYLSDIFDHFNQANLKLQGPETTVIDCKQVMNGFCKRLKLWCDKLQRGNTEMFPGLSEILEETLSSCLIKEFVGHMTNVESEITTRFMEIHDPEKLNFVIHCYYRCFSHF